MVRAESSEVEPRTDDFSAAVADRTSTDGANFRTPPYLAARAGIATYELFDRCPGCKNHGSSLFPSEMKPRFSTVRSVMRLCIRGQAFLWTTSFGVSPQSGSSVKLFEAVCTDQGV